jgi:RNA exonuclease 4
MSNWAALKSRLTSGVEGEAPASKQSRKRPRGELIEAVQHQRRRKQAEEATAASAVKAKANEPPLPPSNYVALDCEMVGVGASGKRSALARCAIVGHDGAVIYDEHVRPCEKITDYRTKWSGVRPQDLKDAISLQQCQREVAALLEGKILVGHALQNDLKVLMLSYPKTQLRDTASYGPLMRASKRTGRLKPRALRVLSKEVLDETIQTGEHSPAEDARAALRVYSALSKEWERSLKTTRAAQKRQRPAQQQQQQAS